MAGDPATQHGADHAGGFLGGGLFARGHAHEGTGLQAQLLGQSRGAVGQELGNTAGESAAFVYLEPAGLVAGLNLHVRQELVDPLSALGKAVHRHGLDRRALEGAEAAALDDFGNVLNLQVDPQVGLVGAVTLHGLVVGDVPEGCLGHPLVLTELLKHRHQHVLQGGQHVLLGGEGHLHVQLVELAGGTVGTGVLVPEAGGDLEVPVKAGGHQQLLELLGSLGQGVELAGMVPGRHQVVSRALRRRSGQNGGGDLQEALLGHEPAQLRHHLAAQNDIALDGRVAQIQEPVLEAGIFVRLLGLVDLKGQLVVNTLAKHLDLLRNHLNFTGGKLGVLALPLPDDTGDGQGGLLVDGLDPLHHVLGLDNHLGSTVVVPEHTEGKVRAHLPDVFQPADNGHGLAGIGKPELAAVMCSGLHHRKDPLSSEFSPYIIPQSWWLVNKNRASQAKKSRQADNTACHDRHIMIFPPTVPPGTFLSTPSGRRQ